MEIRNILKIIDKWYNQMYKDGYKDKLFISRVVQLKKQLTFFQSTTHGGRNNNIQINGNIRLKAKKEVFNDIEEIRGEILFGAKFEDLKDKHLGTHSKKQTQEFKN